MGPAFGGAGFGKWRRLGLGMVVLLLWFSLLIRSMRVSIAEAANRVSTSSVFLLRWPVHASVDRLSVG